MELNQLIGKNAIISKSLKCQTITPLLMHGGDKENRPKFPPPASAQLRIPSIKGLVRYWFRALQVTDGTKMYEQEVKLFGGSSDKAFKSKLLLSLDKSLISKKQEVMLPHRERKFTTPGIPAHTDFTLDAQTYKKDERLFDTLLTYVQLSFYLGGFGQRSRRGFGSIDLVEESFSTVEAWLEHVQSLIEKVSDLPIVRQQSLLTVQKQTALAKHPLLQAVYVGKAFPTASDALLVINQASHDVAKQFSGALGSAKPRHASSLLGSVKKIGDQYYPVVTEVLQQNDDKRFEKAKRVFLEKVGVHF